MTKPARQSLSDYSYHMVLPTRWSDNDIYGHINNAVYYFYFDTAVNKWLIENNLLSVGQSPVIGLVVETSCAYFSPMAFPDDIVAGVRAAKIGHSSVRYEIGLFRNDEDIASAQGHFIHVYVDEASRRPVALPDRMREKLGEIYHDGKTTS